MPLISLNTKKTNISPKEKNVIDIMNNNFININMYI